MTAVTAFTAARGTRALSRRRLLIRRDPAVWPFVWRGLLPALGLLLLLLYAVWPFARGEIEANVRHSVTQALQAKGLDGVNVAVSGQHVLLSGELKPGFNTLEVLNIARGATCPTWLGPQVCAELVLGQFVNAPSLPSVALPAASAAGEAPSPAAAGAASAAARSSCEAALADAVKQRRIEFATGSAALLASSAPVLDTLAEAHKACAGAGTVRVEGHTDNRGSEDGNKRLSLARAEAVRDELLKRGIPAGKLTAAGYGPAQPLADNATAEGRQANRRIEFKVVTAP